MLRRFVGGLLSTLCLAVTVYCTPSPGPQDRGNAFILDVSQSIFSFKRLLHTSRAAHAQPSLKAWCSFRLHHVLPDHEPFGCFEDPPVLFTCSHSYLHCGPQRDLKTPVSWTRRWLESLCQLPMRASSLPPTDIRTDFARTTVQ